MREYYRTGTLDDCRGKWSDFYDCISLKTNPASDVRVRAAAERAGEGAGSPNEVLCISRGSPQSAEAPAPAAPQERVELKLNKPSMWASRTPEEAAAFWASQFPQCTAAVEAGKAAVKAGEEAPK